MFLSFLVDLLERQGDLPECFGFLDAFPNRFVITVTPAPSTQHLGVHRLEPIFARRVVADAVDEFPSVQIFFSHKAIRIDDHAALKAAVSLMQQGSAVNLIAKLGP
jgi:hypothetical protein